ncbi:hypothetical protein BMF35_a2092 [Aurantiacibacter gangjinensis]|nr:hypothetical protein BMF35_a2092 [Aurantiacibacter gangjinensis]
MSSITYAAIRAATQMQSLHGKLARNSKRPGVQKQTGALCYEGGEP